MSGPLLARTLALGVAAAFAATAATIATSDPAGMDFVAQYAAAKLFLLGQGSAVLDPGAILAAEHAAAPARVALLPFAQPPAVALLLAPLAALPFDAAFAFVAAVDAAMILAAVALLRPRGIGAAATALILVAPPSVLAVAQGQTSPLVLLLVAVAARSGRPAGGLALGLAALRPQTAPLLLLAGLADPARRPWALAGAAAVVAASALVVGVDGLVRYAAVLADASLWSVTGELGLRRSIGWSSLALGSPSLGLALSAVGLVVGALVVLRADAAERPRAAAMWSLLASPHVLMHDGLLAYPMLLWLLSRRTAWDVASVVAWLVHLLLAPVAVAWSGILAVVGYARPAR